MRFKYHMVSLIWECQSKNKSKNKGNEKTTGNKEIYFWQVRRGLGDGERLIWGEEEDTKRNKMYMYQPATVNVFIIYHKYVLISKEFR